MRAKRASQATEERGRIARRAQVLRRQNRPPQDDSFKGGSNSVVESQPSKLLVAGSIPVSRSSIQGL